MTQLLAAAAAGALFALLWVTTSLAPVLWAGLLGLALAAVAIAVRWRWAATAAAVVFLVGHAAALRLESRPLDVAHALGFGLALLLLLGAVDLIARARGAALHGRVVGATLGRWIVLVGGTLVAGLLVMELSAVLASALPPAASPVLAAAGGLGSVVILAALLRRAG